MEVSLADELYSETLRLSNVELGPTSTANSKHCVSNGCDEDDWWNEDGCSWDGSNEELDKVSDLDREWQRRRKQLHTVSSQLKIGYRDGLTAGKEASAQEGFNIGFKESVLDGYNCGLVRGVTSALSFLPDGLKEMLVEIQEKRNKFRCLYESVHSLSTADALKMFHDDILTNKSVQSEDAEPSSLKADLHGQSTDGSLLGSYYGELQSLLESAAIKVHLEIE